MPTCNVPPSPRGLLDAADVQDTIVQMVEDLVVGFFAEEGPIGMHTVPCEKCGSSLGDILLDVGQEAVGRVLGCHSGLNDGGSKATLAVCTLSLATLELQQLVLFEEVNGRWVGGGAADIRTRVHHSSIMAIRSLV